MVLRSADFPNMKFNQFLLAPYFGPGLLPHEQTLWIDELAVGTERLGPIAREAGSAAPPAPPQASPESKRRCAWPRPSPGTGRSTSG